MSLFTHARSRIRRSTALAAAVLVVAGAMTAGSAVAPSSPASAAGTASISGTVSAPDDVPASWLEGTNVYAYRIGGGSFVATTQVDSTGAYTLAGVPSGKVAVEFRPSYGTDLIAEYWDGGARIEDATPILVSDGAQIDEIDAHLEHGAWFSGTLDMAALRSAHPGNDRYTLWLTSADGREVISSYSDRLWYDTMDFSFPGLRPGTYRLAVGTHVLDGISTMTSPLSSVQFVRVGSGSAVTLAEREQLRSLALAALPLPSRISGTIGAAGLTLSGVTDVGAVRLYERDGEDWVLLPGYAQDILYQKSVAYSVALTPGEYAVGFESINRAIPAATEWWTGASTITEATWIDLASGEHRSGIDGGIVPVGSPPATRQSGPNRFATSAAVSAASFAPGVPVAYVANGWKFPDALSGAAAAGVLGGPVLLTDEESLPGVIHDELARLKPKKIVILGSEASVRKGVATSLSLYSADVQRVAGEDRFATSAAVSAATFSPGVPVAYLANGWKFPTRSPEPPRPGRSADRSCSPTARASPAPSPPNSPG
ncbi:cell wall-binding repeat-containing protein [Microbacterium sp. 1P10UB]|uniref:cell wall-binding repeat-containing protein n=1 Tax=unclassified Microbacterium TaxID=2609290 RepID=UPI0039A39551